MNTKLDAVETVRELLDRWAASLAQVLESMADARPEIHWQAVSGSFAEVSGGEHADILWWEQPFTSAPGMDLWVAAPRTTWEYAGTLTLKAAGVETIEPAEAKDTWSEILGQSLSVMARSMGPVLGREVTCDTGSETAPSPDAHEWASVSITFPGAPPVPLFVTLNPKLVAMLVAAPQEEDDDEPGHAGAGETPGAETTPPPLRSRTMDLLLEVDLPVSISFGKTQLPMREVIKLTTGSIVELNRGVNEPVEVLVNHSLVARGEVVVVEGNYGVRILEIVSRLDRLRSIR
jgi:flagellar motor switch protein FliN/FliY